MRSVARALLPEPFVEKNIETSLDTARTGACATWGREI